MVGVVNDGDDIGGGHGPCGFDEEDTLVLAADAGATLIADDVDDGDGGITIFGGAFEKYGREGRDGGARVGWG